MAEKGTSVSERLSVLETELPFLWRELKSTGEAQHSIARDVSAIRKEHERIRSFLHIASMLIGASVLQAIGGPAAQFFGSSLKAAAQALLK